MSKRLVCSQLTIADLLVPPIYIRSVVYLPLQPSATPDEVYNVLRLGLIRTIQQIPLLSGKVYLRPPSSPDWRPGQLELRHEDTWDLPTDSLDGPPQLQRKDVSKDIGYTYEELKDLGFPCNLFRDDTAISAPFIPNPAAGVEVFKAQANFVKGGCLLGVAFYHPVADATGMTLMMQAWAAHCKAVSLSEVSWQTTQIAQRLHPTTRDLHVGSVAWSMIGLDETLHQKSLKIQAVNQLLKRLLFFALQLLPILFDILIMLEQTDWTALWSEMSSFAVPAGLKTTGITRTADDILTDDERGCADLSKRPKSMQSSIFYISGSQLSRLKKGLIDSGGPAASALSANDALLALLWRCLMRARVNARHAVTHKKDQLALLQCPMDGRGVYSSSQTTNYIGNFVVLNETSFSLQDLVNPETPLQDVALRVRQSAACITRDTVHQAYVLAREIKDFTAIDHAFTTLEGFALMISSLAAFPAEQFDLGDRLFANKGRADRLRPLMSGFNGAHRFCVVLPFNQQGGLEVVVSLFADEMEELLRDEEFSQYATFFCN
ncbi:hypothetical protein PRZ48_002504 [Zasmidium cellare]|uniref:Trichothecene 3-O-acetyltransferase-like N-terminal domain-containing protein n=1 Tax=Zasmidium cellare TaxID=395010 RepID=A0ABR0F698_ZASCE|nr:hypothetical protein PRZ48_002504 [Zasmidium cellare]